MSDDQTDNSNSPEPSSVTNISGGVRFDAGRDIIIHGDVIGRDKIDAGSGSAQLHYDTRDRYLEQIIRDYRDLGFAGISQLQDRQPLQLEDVFIHLQAEVEAEMPLSEEEQPEEEQRIRREFAESHDAKGLARWQAERNQQAHIRKVTQKLSVNEALAKYSRMVILGDPGAGKTTLLKYVALAFASGHCDKLNLNEVRLPIFIRLYDYVAKRAKRQTDYALVDYLYTQAHENLQVRLETGFFENELERGQCCVCLDGLDELGGAGLQREVVAAVNALVNKYPHNRYLITSRLVGYEEAPLNKREFAHHTILPFTDDDIQVFVTKWYAARENGLTATVRSKHLINAIEHEPRIKMLATNPLMLTIIALIHHNEAELPHKRVTLYDKCVTTLIETWDKDKRLTVEDSLRPYYKYRRRLLEQLAYWIHSQSGERGHAHEVKEGDLELQIRRFLLENSNLSLDDETAHQEARDFVNLIKGRTGLLIERGAGVYAFPHPTFQEYLAATDIERRLAPGIDAIWGEIQPRLFDPHWREVILLLLGNLHRFERLPANLVRRIYESTDRYEPVLHRHLYLAARALADHVDIESNLHQAIVDQLMVLVNAPDWWGHNDAFAALGSLEGDNYAAQSLLDFAKNPQVWTRVRINAALALGELGRADEAAPILLAIARDPRAQVGGDAAQALGKLGYADEATLNGLLAIAQVPTVDEVEQYAAVEALGALGRATEAVLNGLLVIAKDSQANSSLRHDVVLALGKLGRNNRAAHHGLLSLALNAQGDTWIQREAMGALGELGRADEVTVNCLLAIAQDPLVEETNHQVAAEALVKLGRVDEAAPILIAIAHNPLAEGFRKIVVTQQLVQLGRADEAELKTLLTAELADMGIEDDDTPELSHDAKVNALRGLAQDPEVSIRDRRGFAQALGELGHVNEAVHILLSIAQDPQAKPGTTLDVAKSLDKLGRADEAAPILLALAQNPQEARWLRGPAVQALGRLTRVDKAVLNALLAFAQDPQVDEGTRYDSVQALGRLGNADEAVLNGLLVLAQDRKVNPNIRRSAYDGLKALLGGETSA